MKIKIQILTFITLLALLVVPTSAVFAQGPSPDGGRVVFGENFTLESGETFDGDLVVFGGNVTIEEDAELNGNLVVFGGTITSDGDINGDLVIFGGQIELKDHAVVDGDVVTVGGQLNQAAGAEIRGDVVDDIPAPVAPSIPSVPDVPSIPDVPSVPDVNIPNVSVRFNPFFEFGRILGVSILMAFLGALGTLFFQDRLSRVSQAVVNQPLMTSSIGLLAIVALILVAFTIILIPFALLGLIPLGLAWLFGVVAIGQEIGDRFAKAVRTDWTPVVTAGVGTFVLTFLLASVQALNDFLPLLVCVTWILPAAIGLLAIGSVAITRFGARPVQGPGMIVNPTPPPVSEL
jgi:cytoskeletal protein CcmA (bactofilin family)